MICESLRSECRFDKIREFGVAVHPFEEKHPHAVVGCLLKAAP
jgi:hypothetical protein